MKMVQRRFPESPGRLDDFDYPVTRAQARAALRDFVEHRLPNFGTYQDAMVTDEPYLYHSRLSCVLNLHLLDLRDAIREQANGLKSTLTAATLSIRKPRTSRTVAPESLRGPGDLDLSRPEAVLRELNIDQIVSRMSRLRGGTSRAREHLERVLRVDFRGNDTTRNDPA